MAVSRSYSRGPISSRSHLEDAARHLRDLTPSRSGIIFLYRPIGTAKSSHLPRQAHRGRTSLSISFFLFLLNYVLCLNSDNKSSYSFHMAGGQAGRYALELGSASMLLGLAFVLLYALRFVFFFLSLSFFDSLHSGIHLLRPSLV
jgi:hypothetical protein